MRLFEVDAGSARTALAVLQGQLNRDNDSNKDSFRVPFDAVLNLIRPFHLGISTPDGLIALKNASDPDGDVIKDIETSADGQTFVVIKSARDDAADAADIAVGGPDIDSMASRASKKPSPF
jgi:hypothetical protein